MTSYRYIGDLRLIFVKRKACTIYFLSVFGCVHYNHIRANRQKQPRELMRYVCCFILHLSNVSIDEIKKNCIQIHGYQI